MKKNIIVFLCTMLTFLLVCNLNAQVPEGLNYQAIARDTNIKRFNNKESKH